MLATAVLITREKEYPKEVLDSLPAFDEVLIETECPSVLRRYELAAKAKNDLIYVQDDDCIVDVIKLFGQYNGQITHAITPNHFSFYRDTGITLIGWGAFFPKKMINFDKYIDKYGINPLFLSQADRVFTYLNNPFNSVIIPVQHLPTATLGDRMSLQSDHWSKLSQIKEQLNNL